MNRALAATAAAWVAALAPAAAATYPELRYGPSALQTLDLQVPDGAGAAPLVVYFHGGGFFSGDKHPCAPQLAAELGAQGIAFACVNYRLVPQVHYPTPMLDGARAVQWLRANANRYGLDGSRVGLMGMSAGAGIAMWVAFRPDLAAPGSPDPVLRESTAVAAVVTGNAQATYDPADIRTRLHTSRLPKWLADLYGAGSVETVGAAQFKRVAVEASPINNMHAGEPPLLAYYAKPPEELPPDSPPQSYVHSPAQGDILATVARERGADVTLVTAADTGGWRGFLDTAVTFFRSKLGR